MVIYAYEIYYWSKQSFRVWCIAKSFVYNRSYSTIVYKYRDPFDSTYFFHADKRFVVLSVGASVIANARFMTLYYLTNDSVVIKIKNTFFTDNRSLHFLHGVRDEGWLITDSVCFFRDVRGRQILKTSSKRDRAVEGLRVVYILLWY